MHVGKSAKCPVPVLVAKGARKLPFSHQPFFTIRRMGVNPAVMRRHERGKMKKATWASVALAAGLLALIPTAAQADAPEVRNTSTIAVGAVQYWAGNTCAYRQGCYDALIPAGRFSGWPSTAAIYSGPGFCVRIRYWAAGYTEQNPPPPEGLSDPIIYRFPASSYPNGGFIHFTDSRSWDVRALSLSHADCNTSTSSAKTDSLVTVEPAS
jgi:hypothetical protein